MLGANEDLGCPRILFKQVPYNKFSIRLAKFLTTFFSRSKMFFQFVFKHFCRPSFLLIYPNFPLFRISSRKFAPWMPPSAASCPVTTFFSSFLAIYLHFTKTGLLDAPRVDARHYPILYPITDTRAVFI